MIIRFIVAWFTKSKATAEDKLDELKRQLEDNDAVLTRMRLRLETCEMAHAEACADLKEVKLQSAHDAVELLNVHSIAVTRVALTMNTIDELEALKANKIGNEFRLERAVKTLEHQIDQLTPTAATAALA